MTRIGAATSTSTARFRELAQSVDPDDPWSHPRARELDSISVSALAALRGGHPQCRASARAGGERPGRRVQRTHLAALGPAQGGRGRRARVLRLRRLGVPARGRGLCHRGAAGGGRAGAPDPLRHARHHACASGRPAARSPRRPASASSREAVVCALPVGPLRRVEVDGVSRERMDSLHRQKNAVVAKPVFVWADSFWERNGQNGDRLHGDGPDRRHLDPARGDHVGAGAAGALRPVPRHSGGRARGRRCSRRSWGRSARRPASSQAFYLRRWGADPWTLGYITSWRPGDVMGVGPLHGTHEPPFYVCGSDQWVCGYMEGAVRTGSSARARPPCAGRTRPARPRAACCRGSGRQAFSAVIITGA